MKEEVDIVYVERLSAGMLLKVKPDSTSSQRYCLDGLFQYFFGSTLSRVLAYEEVNHITMTICLFQALFSHEEGL